MAEPAVCPTCGSTLGPEGSCSLCSPHRDAPPLTLGSEAGVLVVLTAIAIVFFVLTGMAVGSYRSKENQLAREWTARGRSAMGASRPAGAVEAFQTALRYDPGSLDLRYGLVDAMLAAGRSEQARSYLLNMWEHEPANGRVNLLLGRVAADRQDVSDATRYYHNAIYGVWDDAPQQHRIEARLELARFLLSQKAKREADAELLALAANAPPSPELSNTLGKLFLEAGDLDNAEEQFELFLRASPRDPNALAAAGRIAFQLGKYSAALAYFERARAHGNNDAETARLLNVSDLILKSDPLDRRAAFEVRVQRAIKALSTANERLEACAALTDNAGGTPPQIEQLLQQIGEAQDAKNIRTMRHDPDRLISSTNLVFAAEDAAAQYCGKPQGLDLALLLIGRSHAEGGQ